MNQWVGVLADQYNLSTKLDQCILSAVSLLTLKLLSEYCPVLMFTLPFEDCSFIAAVWMSDRYDQHRNSFWYHADYIVLLIDVFQTSLSMYIFHIV